MTRVDDDAGLRWAQLAAGTVYLAGDPGVLRVDGDLAVPVEVLAGEGEPTTTGPVRAIAPWDTSLLVLAAHGLFYTTPEGRLIRSPLSDAPDLDGLDAFDRIAAEDSDTLWLAGPLTSELTRATSTSLEKVNLGLTAAGVDAIAALPGLVVVASGGTVAQLDTSTWEVRSVATEAPAPVRTVVLGGETWVSTDQALLRRDVDGAWHRLELGAAVWALAPAASETGVLAATPTGVVLVRGDEATAFAALPDEDVLDAVALDVDGHTIAVTSSSLSRWATGDPVSFADDVAPILEPACNGCHATGVAAPKRDFSEYGTAASLAETIVERVATGVMPPPPNPGLTSDQLDLLVRWLDGGLAP